MNRIKAKLISLIYDYIYIPVYFFLVYFRDLKRIKKVYGDYECLSRADQKKFTLNFFGESRNVTGVYVSEIVKSILDLKLDPKKILLDGDDKSIVDQFKRRFNFGKSEVVTAGKDGNFDYDWDFEQDYPASIFNDFNLIISQAMFEHLIDPYKHFQDLSALLREGGYLIIHTVMPGYTYHRYPIDAVRFFPDWFEEAAGRNELKIKRKFLRNFHIIYLFEKQIK